MPLIDMRVRLGMQSYKDELSEFCSQREEDHKGWIAELERSIKENQQFKLTVDPHKCAFGKWYDSFRTSDIILAQLLKEFDVPHKKIHGIAEKVLKLAASGNEAGALAVINECKNSDLATMIRLLRELRHNFSERNREIAVVIDTGKEVFAITVDSINSACQLDEESIEEMKIAVSYEKGLVDLVGRIKNDNRSILIINEEMILKKENN